MPPATANQGLVRQLQASTTELSGLLAEARDLLSSIDAKTSADQATGADLAAIQARLTTDPPTGAKLDQLIASMDAAVAKLADDPPEGADIAALKGSVDTLVAKTDADQATGADINAVVTQLQAMASVAATNAQLQALGTIVTNSAAILPTGAATEASVDGIEGLLTTIRDRSIVGPASEATLVQVRDEIVLPPALTGDGRLAVQNQAAADRSISPVTITANGQAATITVEAGDVEIGLSTRTLATTTLTLTIEAQYPDGQWRTAYASNLNGGSTGAPSWSNVSAAVYHGYRIPVPAGVVAIRARATSFTTGQLEITLSASKTPAIHNRIGVDLQGVTAVSTSGDNVTSLNHGVGLHHYNGATLDRNRGNIQQNALASASRTAIANSGDITNYNHTKATVWLNVTAVSGTGGLTLRLEGKALTPATYQSLGADPVAITAIGLYRFEYGLGVDVANTTARKAFATRLPRTFRATVAHGDPSSYTYSVDVELGL